MTLSSDKIAARAKRAEVVGYSDQLSVAAGREMAFHVSCRAPSYQVDIVRLRRGAKDIHGTGLKEEVIPELRVPPRCGVEHSLPSGSYVRIDAVVPRLDTATWYAWIFPTTANSEEQGIVAAWSGYSRPGFALVVSKHGVGARISDGVRAASVTTGRPLRPWTWYFVAAVWDGCRLRVVQRPRDPFDAEPSATALCEADIGPITSPGPLTIAALSQSAPDHGAHFNGKIEAPTILHAAVDIEHLPEEMLHQRPPSVAPVVAAWDFARDFASDHVEDASPSARHGVAVNHPLRAVTGLTWDGSEPDARRSPRAYGAIRFHDDDLDDACWPAAFSIQLPSDLPSGIYAAKLTTGDAVDRVPFIVRPAPGAATSPIAVVIPTVTYQAYGGAYSPWFEEGGNDRAMLACPKAIEYYGAHHRLLSLYDRHRDGSGNCFASSHRPMPLFRPDAILAWVQCPAHLPIDLELLAWLSQKGFAYDVLSDHDVHRDGAALLGRYRTIITGQHPEYATNEMMCAYQAYLAGGGRMMNLGGNGFYWVASIDRCGHTIEVRKSFADPRPGWATGPGEQFHASTGELGGLWRHRSWPPQRLAGVGLSASGRRSLPYRRSSDSYDARAAFIFEGIGDGELIIGDFGMVMGGAGGHEVDRLDYRLGTPPHALLLASAIDESADGLAVVPEDLGSRPRADMAFFETSNGGGVFSVGSMAWCGSLAHRRYDNNVSRITENVLRRFSAHGPLTPASAATARMFAHEASSQSSDP
jgi:N,N-dimethylformamidase